MCMSHFWYPSCTPSCNAQLAGIRVSVACYSLLLRLHAIKCPPTSLICPSSHVYNQLSVYKSFKWLTWDFEHGIRPLRGTPVYVVVTVAYKESDELETLACLIYDWKCFSVLSTDRARLPETAHHLPEQEACSGYRWWQGGQGKDPPLP